MRPEPYLPSRECDLPGLECDLPHREAGIRPDRPPVRERVRAGARAVLARHILGERLDPRLLEWAEWITKYNP